MEQQEKTHSVYLTALVTWGKYVWAKQNFKVCPTSRKTNVFGQELEVKETNNLVLKNKKFAFELEI